MSFRLSASQLLLRALIGAIGLYQKILSPDHSVWRGLFPHGVCRYQPTCSEYCQQALCTYGWLGFGMGVRRILRCHPLAQGGYDPVPSEDGVASGGSPAFTKASVRRSKVTTGAAGSLC